MAFGFSSRSFERISSNQLKTSGRVSPDATCPSSCPTGTTARLSATARWIAKPGTMTSESPPIQRRNGRFGEKAGFAAGVSLGGGGGSAAGVPAPSSSSPISVSISSIPLRPMAACTPARGRSRNSAWLTALSGPVKASATSRFHPSGWLYALLWIPGAFRSAAMSSVRTQTTSACPALHSRRWPSTRGWMRRRGLRRAGPVGSAPPSPPSIGGSVGGPVVATDRAMVPRPGRTSGTRQASSRTCGRRSREPARRFAEGAWRARWRRSP